MYAFTCIKSFLMRPLHDCLRLRCCESPCLLQVSCVLIFLCQTTHFLQGLRSCDAGTVSGGTPQGKMYTVAKPLNCSSNSGSNQCTRNSFITCMQPITTPNFACGNGCNGPIGANFVNGVLFQANGQDGCINAYYGELLKSPGAVLPGQLQL